MSLRYLLIKEMIEKIRGKIGSFDVFELGNSAVICYILMFGLLPLAIFLRIPSNYIKYIKDDNLTSFLYSPRVIFYLVLGFISFIAGYWLLGYLLRKYKLLHRPILMKEWNSRGLLTVFLSILGVNLFVKIVKIVNDVYFHLNRNTDFTHRPIYDVIGYLDWLGPLCVAMSFAYYFHLLKNKDNGFRFWRFIAWAVLAIEFGYGLFTLGTFVAILPVVVYLIVRHYFYERSYKRIIIAGIISFLVIMPVQSFYKTQGVSGTASDILEKKHLLAPLKERPVSTIAAFIFDSSVGRIDESHVVAYIFENGNKFMAAENLYPGRTLLDFFISFGPPRLIWKDKPVNINGKSNIFGREIGYLRPDNYRTALGPTVIGDWYLNFGLTGIILGMLFLGALMRFVFAGLIGQSPGLTGVVIYSIFWPQIIMGMESWVAPVWSSLLKLFIMMLFVHYLLTWAPKKVIN